MAVRTCDHTKHKIKRIQPEIVPSETSEYEIIIPVDLHAIRVLGPERLSITYVLDRAGVQILTEPLYFKKIKTQSTHPS